MKHTTYLSSCFYQPANTEDKSFNLWLLERGSPLFFHSSLSKGRTDCIFKAIFFSFDPCWVAEQQAQAGESGGYHCEGPRFCPVWTEERPTANQNKWNVLIGRGGESFGFATVQMT